MPTLIEGVSIAGAGGSSVVLLGTLFRFLTRGLRSERSEIAQNKAEVDGYVRQRIEIERLDRKVIEMEAVIISMQEGIANRRAHELETATDIALLAIIFDQLPCEKCTSEQDALFVRGKLILEKLKTRAYGYKELVNEG